MTATQQLLATRADQSAERLFGRAYDACTAVQKRFVVRDVHERNPMLITALAGAGVVKEDEMKTFSERVIDATEKLKAQGFSEADIATSPGLRERIVHLAAAEERDAERTRVESTVQSVAREFNLDPKDYNQRREIFRILAQRRHALYTDERYGLR